MEHGIYNQEAISDFDYRDSIKDGYSYSNLFFYISQLTPIGGPTYWHNYYKFWAAGLFKREWVWGDTTDLVTRERVPFQRERGTGLWDLEHFTDNYRNRFKEFLRDFATYEHSEKLIITLFDFHYSAWNNNSWTGSSNGAWCIQGPLYEPPAGVALCQSHGGGTVCPGNPWYPLNNKHNLSDALPICWIVDEYSTCDDLGWEFFPPPNSQQNSPEYKLYHVQLNYVDEILNLVKQAYDGQSGHPSVSNIGKVIVEIMHEMPGGGDNATADHVWAWFNGISAHVYDSFKLFNPRPQIAVMINKDDALLVKGGDCDVELDLFVTTESNPAGYQYTWWTSSCSTDYLDDWVETVQNGLGDDDIPNSESIFLDTDGNGHCRDDNDSLMLGEAAEDAADLDYNFSHLESATDINGNARRDDEALKKIAIAYDSCSPSCP